MTTDRMNQDTHETIRIILDKVFTPEKRRQAHDIDRIARLNREVDGVPADGFTYSGTVYRPTTAPTRGRLTYRPLHLSLNPDILSLVQDIRKSDIDRQFMQQALFRLLHGLKYAQQCRDALPEALVGFLPETASLSRDRPAAYTLDHNPRAIEQYEKMLPIIEFYSATRYVY